MGLGSVKQRRVIVPRCRLPDCLRTPSDRLVQILRLPLFQSEGLAVEPINKCISIFLSEDVAFAARFKPLARRWLWRRTWQGGRAGERSRELVGVVGNGEVILVKTVSTVAILV